jgi:hypothetical protein
MKKSGLDDYVIKCMSDFRWWTFWDLQRMIQTKTGKFYGEPTISAAIRNIRKDYMRLRHDLPCFDEVVERRRIPMKKGYQYKLTSAVMAHWSKK